MATITASEFSADKLKFQAPKKLEQGGVIGMSYEGAPLEMKIQASRVPFDCVMGFKGEGKKLVLQLEIPDTADYKKTRDVMKQIEEAARAHVRDNAKVICDSIGFKAAKENDLRNGANFHGLLRPAKDPKYPDTLTMKWAEPKDGEYAKVKIVDFADKTVKWNVIKRDATVVSSVRIKGIFINSNMWSIQVEAVALCVISTKKEVCTSSLFADEMAQAAKRQRIMSGPSSEEEEESEGA